MSKKTKQVTKKEKRRTVRRQERRFVPQASGNTTAVRAAGALAAMLLGAGVWGYLYAQSLAEDEKLKSLPMYLIAAGAVLSGIALWFGSSSESPVRVGAPGIAVEKGDVRRMPWWSIEKIAFDAGGLGLVVAGKDEAGVAWTVKMPLKTHPDAVAWLVKEARHRIPGAVDIADELQEKLPLAAPNAGTLVDLEPLQVVGRKDAVSGKTISYEPDACVCSRCERIYMKRSVPKKCACGNSLAQFRANDGDDDTAEDEDSDESSGSESADKVTAEQAAES